MKTLIINGSPRLEGNTYDLINALLQRLNGKYKIIDAYYGNISPCTDCRCCHKKAGCIKKDGMAEIYDYINNYDNIIIASPVYFEGLTPPVLSILSRLQAFYCAKRFLDIELCSANKKGGIILTGGGDGKAENAVRTAKMLLHQMGARDIFDPVCSLNTDTVPALEDKQALMRISALAVFLNSV